MDPVQKSSKDASITYSYIFYIHVYDIYAVKVVSDLTCIQMISAIMNADQHLISPPVIESD